MLIWEEIRQDTAGTLQRTKVFGGWLVREVHEVYVDLPDNFILDNRGYTWTSSIAFIPDIEHKWEIKK